MRLGKVWFALVLVIAAIPYVPSFLNWAISTYGGGARGAATVLIAHAAIIVVLLTLPAIFSRKRADD